MVYLVAAVVVLTVLCFLNLVLTFGIIRHLRDKDVQDVQAEPTVGIGQRVGEAGTDGGPRLTGFFTPDCKACAEEWPRFTEFAAGFAGEVVAVVVADDPAQALAYQKSVRTVVEPPGGVMATAFGVTSFPALAVTDADGVVLANGNSVRDLRMLGESKVLSGSEAMAVR